jgi:hypothetical protein
MSHRILQTQKEKKASQSHTTQKEKQAKKPYPQSPRYKYV